MNDAEAKLAQDRGVRQAARGLFDTRLAQVKQDLASRSVPARAKAKVQDEAIKAVDLGLDVAKESKGVIAATLGALALWFFRKPLIEAAQGWLGQGGVHDDAASDEPDLEEEHLA
jgi:hypothetical protein